MTRRSPAGQIHGIDQPSRGRHREHNPHCNCSNHTAAPAAKLTQDGMMLEQRA
jgi:hypothetical protein